MIGVEVVKGPAVYRLVVKPDDAVDLAILQAMVIRANKQPASIQMVYNQGRAIISVHLED